MRFRLILSIVSFLWLNTACSGGLFSGNTNVGGVSQVSGENEDQSQEADSDWIIELESSRLDVAEKKRDYIEQHIGNDTIELEGFEFANLLDIAEDNLYDLESSPEGDLTVAERFEELGLDPYSFEAPTSDEFDETLQFMSDMALYYTGAESERIFESELKLQNSCPDMTGEEMGNQIAVMGQIEMMLSPKGGWPDTLSKEQEDNRATVAAAAALGERLTIQRGQAFKAGCPNMSQERLEELGKQREEMGN